MYNIKPIDSWGTGFGSGWRTIHYFSKISGVLEPSAPVVYCFNVIVDCCLP